jgi:glyoxylate reductase
LARVFVTRELPGQALERLRQRHDVEVWPAPLPPTPEQLAAGAQAADALITLPSDRVDAALIDHSPQLRAIGNYAVGYDNIDLDAASARQIQVGNTPDVLTDATADLTFALLLAAARNLPAALAAARGGEWSTWEPARYLGADVYGATLGIIGRGRIGSAVARRAEGFQMEVLHTHSRSERSELEDLLGRSDFVSLHCPLTPVTRHLINHRALAQMKPSAILINTGRGGLIDQQSLIDALEQGTIAAAALDVTDPEPPAPDDPILSAPNLVLTPHIGSATRTARERMAEIAVENVLAALDGQPMPHTVTAGHRSDRGRNAQSGR